MNDFRPPKLNRACLALANGIIPLALRSRKVIKVNIEPSTIDRLKSLKNDRVVLLPNHPTNTEPAILFMLARACGQPFYFVACRESFDLAGGLWGAFIQRIGAYSLVRGALDRASFSKSREIISSPGSKLVIFPEGEVYSQNDSLLPFQTGVVQLAFWGLEDALKVDSQSDVILLPIAVRYRFVDDMSLEIEKSICRLEDAVGLPIGKSKERYDRIRQVGSQVVRMLEAPYDIVPTESDSLGQRMDVVKRTQLERAAQIAGVTLKGGNVSEEMRAVVNAVHRVTNDSSSAKSSYERKLWVEDRNHLLPAMHELDRLSNWIAVYDGYVAEDPSPERIVHLLVRMEKEVLGSVSISGRQCAELSCGSEVRLADYLDEYRENRRDCVQQVTRLCENGVQEELRTLALRANVPRNM